MSDGRFGDCGIGYCYQTASFFAVPPPESFSSGNRALLAGSWRLLNVVFRRHTHQGAELDVLFRGHLTLKMKQIVSTLNGVMTAQGLGAEQS